MTDIQSAFLAQLDLVLTQFKEITLQAEYDDFSDIPYDVYTRFHMVALAVIDRVAGFNSIYAKQANSFPIDGKHLPNSKMQLPLLAGILLALRDDISNGFLNTTRELIHGEVFDDFLEMADFLLNEGYKDAAAIMGGGVLENHLRQLCIKNGIDIDTAVGEKLQKKRADRLNSDLAHAGVYGKSDQKNITAWLDLRNNAAHAHYDAYSY